MTLLPPPGPRALLPLGVTLAGALLACQPETAGEEPPSATMADPPAPEAMAETPTAVKIVEKDNLVDFSWSWPAEAAAVPAIDARFRKEAQEALADLRGMAEEGAAMRAEQKIAFNGYEGSKAWETEGDTHRLLSLSAKWGSYTGGAHPNHGTDALLWDREDEAQIDLATLFGDKEERDAALREAFCTDLAAQQLERRGEVISGMFSECPALGEITIIPVDRDGNGRFERFALTADPYVAGPYAEGYYEVELPIGPMLLDALDARYAGDFETAS
ncbi:PdaC/SigV domain-containing protein [Sphingomicrobium aestuariivivum]|uniref:PdaC/SigV domain-containing protein n=1 Tax=Sphingomicrobium aestuariivivum TaxID=1582356 RepID=UPI001FD64A7F|nr:DUF4163 domain-containing protein [Sphingomicrobium aestuariivivum]MCJ8190324.1 DUF4163 domain-containing protein [Sphingomicrobium aestuariivivum]